MKTIYKQAIETFGIQAQSLMLAEECSELVKACSKACRAGDNIDFDMKLNIAEEIADVRIMVEQMKAHYNITEFEIEKFKNEKIMRLASRIDAISKCRELNVD